MAPMRLCPDLPDEIIQDEILARLPAKSALGCRCLSRAWAAALSSDDFTDRYHSIHGGRPKILRMQDYPYNHDEDAKPPPGIPIAAITADCFPRFVTVFWDALPPPAPGPTHLYSVTVQCRGLILVELFPTGIHFLCNPSTGQKRALPEGRTTGCRRPSDLVHRYASLGLAYDARARRHKVVRVYYYGDCDGDGEGRPTSVGCEVYVVNGAPDLELWRPVRSTPPAWLEPYSPSVFAQGHVYWLAHRKHNGNHGPQEMIIVSFSVCRETFATVPSPQPGMDDEEALRKRLCLTELAGRLCFFQFHNHDHRYDVWLLRGHGSSAVWDLHCRIDQGTSSPEMNRVMRGRYNNYNIVEAIPLAITVDGRLILMTQSNWPDDIWICSPSTGDIEMLLDLKSVDGDDGKNILLQIAVYEESVASPGRQPCRDIILTSSPSTQALSLVLRLLPNRTLGMLMCVCRSWRALVAMDIYYARADLQLRGA